jgi:hypothetical protein
MLNQLAQITLQPQGDTNVSALSGLTLERIISALIKGSLIVAAVVFFFILVMGGIKWIASGGDKGQTEAARNQITAALVGLIIVFAAWAIVQLVNTFFGVNIFNLTIPKV